jgi:hypothetical protein
MSPLCHLTVTLRFFRLNRLGLVAKIYPLLSFDSPLEYLPEKTISMASYYVHITGSLEKPLLEFSPLQHKQQWKTSLGAYCRIHQEHFQGLFTFLAFVASQSLGSYFISDMLMGFTSQSFLPCSNRWPFQARLTPLRFISRSY